MKLTFKYLNYSENQFKKMNFLEPAVGLGSFYSSLLKTTGGITPALAVGIENDKLIAPITRALWSEYGLKIINADFTALDPPDNENSKFDLIITNPPYVRHHFLLDIDKKRLAERVEKFLEIKPNKRMGLYGYFLLLSHKWMKNNAISVWLIPREFMDTNYGKILKQYLTQKVQLLQIHRFDINDIKFNDALVASAVIIFKNAIPDRDQQILFTTGKNINSPDTLKMVNIENLKATEKWSLFLSEKDSNIKEISTIRLGDIFKVTRGIATGNNDFFIISENFKEEMGISSEFLLPTLPRPKYMNTFVIESDENGIPCNINKLYILNCTLKEKELILFPNIYRYIKDGEFKKYNESFLTRKRTPWYKLEKRNAAPIVCSYSGRKTNHGNSIRFYRNKSNAIVTNSYYNLYPLINIDSSIANQYYDKLVNILNHMDQDLILSYGRAYGGGLNKVEPKELENVKIPLIEPIF